MVEAKIGSKVPLTVLRTVIVDVVPAELT